MYLQTARHCKRSRFSAEKAVKLNRQSYFGWFAVILTAFVVWVYASPEEPPWWTEHNVLLPTAETNDYAPVNMGQLKWIATNAYAELNAHLPGGAGAELQAVMKNWLVDGTNYALVNIGQLKFLTSLFYDRLIEVGYTDAYPWTDDPNANDYAPANIGQVKQLFSFDFAAKDTDGDGMPDAWEVDNGLNPLVDDAGEDLDNDGLSNLLEYQNGTDPNNPDTDHDGMPDGWEVANGLNPLVDDGSGNLDNDELTNREEYEQGLDPTKANVEDTANIVGLEVYLPIE